jgi:hypothetical protein
MAAARFPARTSFPGPTESSPPRGRAAALTTAGLAVTSPHPPAVLASVPYSFAPTATAAIALPLPGPRGSPADYQSATTFAKLGSYDK